VVATAVGWGGVWGVWSGPGLVWMRCCIFAVLLLWGGRFCDVGQCVGVRWRADGIVDVLLMGPVPAGVRVYISVGHL